MSGCGCSGPRLGRASMRGGCGCDSTVLERHAAEHSALRQAGMSGLRGLGGFSLAALRGTTELSEARRIANAMGSQYVIIRDNDEQRFTTDQVYDRAGEFSVVMRVDALRAQVPFHEPNGEMGRWEIAHLPAGVQRPILQNIPRYLGYVGLAVLGVSAIAAGYHGYKRSGGSVGRTLGWAALGAIAPIITLPVAFGQGFGKRG